MLCNFGCLLTSEFVSCFETMANTPLDTNQEIPMLATPCNIPLTGNVGVPLMATLNLPGFTLGLLVWLFSTPIVLNAPYASQVSSLYQGHQNTASPSPVVDSPTPSTSCGESTDTGKRQSKRSKRRRNRKKTHKQGCYSGFHHSWWITLCMAFPCPAADSLDPMDHFLSFDVSLIIP